MINQVHCGRHCEKHLFTAMSNVTFTAPKVDCFTNAMHAIKYVLFAYRFNALFENALSERLIRTFKKYFKVIYLNILIVIIFYLHFTICIWQTTITILHNQDSTWQPSYIYFQIQYTFKLITRLYKFIAFNQWFKANYASPNMCSMLIIVQ